MLTANRRRRTYRAPEWAELAAVQWRLTERIGRDCYLTSDNRLTGNRYDGELFIAYADTAAAVAAQAAGVFTGYPAGVIDWAAFNHHSGYGKVYPPGLIAAAEVDRASK